MGNKKDIAYLEDIAYEIRKNLILLAERTTIHIGGDLSVTEILTVLWQRVLKYDFANPSWEERDRFIVSKGHCAVTVAFNLAIQGCFSVEDIFEEYATNECRFSMAPCKHKNLFYESSATGSLGQGLSIAVGIALALRAKGNKKSKVYVVMGDGELQEGSNWEAIMYAAQLKLDNLVVIIDNNGVQFDGMTDDIVSVQNMIENCINLGWSTVKVDGNNIKALLKVFNEFLHEGKPLMINAKTIKGKGVDYMENNYKWHAGRIKAEMLESTLKKLEDNYNRGK